MNVVQTPEGETYIPASQRPDGTWRKARKVKDGYVPQEEVPLYQSKGRQWAANRPSYPVGLDPELIRASEAKQTTTRVTPVRQAATLSKPLYPVGLDPELIKASEGAKKKKKKQKSTVANTQEVKPDSQENSAAPCQPAGDPVKRLRNLKKKLKEIIALEEKVKTKEVKNLDKDQIEKLSRKSCIEDEIAAIEFENSLKISD